MRLSRVLVVLGVIAAALARPAPASATDASVLDEAAQSGQLSPVWEKWFQVDRAVRLDWARRFLAGGGTFTAVAPLVLDLWQGGRSGRPEADAERREAVTMFFYGYLRLRIDGQYCRDVSSPADLLYFYFMDLREVIQFAAALPPDTVRVIAAEAAALEYRSAATRGTDRYVCARGRLTIGSDVFLAGDVAQRLALATRERALQEIWKIGEQAPGQR